MKNLDIKKPERRRIKPGHFNITQDDRDTVTVEFTRCGKTFVVELWWGIAADLIEELKSERSTRSRIERDKLNHIDLRFGIAP